MVPALSGAGIKLFTSDTLCSTIYMVRIRRGGYIFRSWQEDHPPRHIHVSEDDELLAKVILDKELSLLEGKISRRIKKIIKELVEEGLL